MFGFGNENCAILDLCTYHSNANTVWNNTLNYRVCISVCKSITSTWIMNFFLYLTCLMFMGNIIILIFFNKKGINFESKWSKADNGSSLMELGNHCWIFRVWPAASNLYFFSRGCIFPEILQFSFSRVLFAIAVAVAATPWHKVI